MEKQEAKMKRISTLKWAIGDRRAVVVPGCHDVLSAKIIEQCGFEAVQVSGFGLAGSFLGKPDVGLVSSKEILDLTWNIVQAVSIPVMADLDTGFGNAINAIEATKRLITIGIAGMNIEDQFFPKRCGHMSGKEVISAEEMIGKVLGCAEVRDRLNKEFVINARTDAFASLGLDEAIRRCNLYAKAGADLVFIDGIKTKVDIQKAVRGVNAPLSINLMEAVTGVQTELVPLQELASMGIGRVSIPVASIMVAHKALTDFFTALHSSPTGILLGQTQWISSFEDYTNFVGLKDYKEMEKAFLPKESYEQKYGS